MRDLADVQQADGAPNVDKRAVGPHALHHAHHHVANLRGILFNEQRGAPGLGSRQMVCSFHQ